MLMPTGPPAMKLTAIADVNGASEDKRMAIAKFIAASYAVSPMIYLRLWPVSRVLFLSNMGQR
ncbi:hypothetical protein BJ875DRAFT_463037, partial [Amylocarpus encephaloides]